MTWRLAVDVGGTFTDVVALNEDTGEEEVVKTASTPDDMSQAFLTGIEEIVSSLEIEAPDVGMLFHGTTVATNAILEAKYAPMGLIVPTGFREMLECARQTVPGDFGDIMWWINPPRVVPLELIREIEGRLNFRGEELRPLDDDEIRLRAAEFRELGIEAIAVSLLHSYRDPSHEEHVPRGNPGRVSGVLRLDLLRRDSRVPRVRAHAHHVSQHRAHAAPVFVYQSSGRASQRRRARGGSLDHDVQRRCRPRPRSHPAADRRWSSPRSSTSASPALASSSAQRGWPSR